MTAIAVIYWQMFITFEGLDGSGKTTQVHLLAARLEAEGVEVVITREPGGTPLGEQIRDLVLHGGDMAPWAEAALYAASRAQHVEEVIRPALARGATVLCDRFVDSSVAYQGIARGLGLDRVLDLNLAAVGGLMPDRTILLDIASAGAVARMGEERDRIEREDEGFHARAADAYRQLAILFPERYLTVDGTAAPELIAEEIYGALRRDS
jgi:dTMP kinase